MATVVFQPYLPVPPSPSEYHAMQSYSHYTAPMHDMPAQLSSFTPSGLFDDEDPLPLWQTGHASYADSLDSASTGGSSTPDSNDMSPFQLPATSVQPSSPSTSSASSSSSPSPSRSSRSSTALAVTTAPAKRKRQRLAGVSKEERLAMAVIRHREIDGARRQREKDVVQRLERLTTSSDDVKADDADEAAAAKKGRRGKREKVDVLEESAELIEQLKAQVRRMEESSGEKDLALVKLRAHMYATERAGADSDELALLGSTKRLMSGHSYNPLQLLPADTADAPSLIDASPTTASMSALLKPAGPCMLLVQQGTGAVLEANERFVQLSGYALSALLFTVLRPPVPGTHARVCPLMLRHSQARGAPKDGTYVSQYNSSRKAILDLCTGREWRVELLWRLCMADGQLYEVQFTAFVTRQGVMVWLCNLEDAVLVEQWDDSAAKARTGMDLGVCVGGEMEETVTEETMRRLGQEGTVCQMDAEGRVGEQMQAK